MVNDSLLDFRTRRAYILRMAQDFLEWIRVRKEALRRELAELEAAERVYLKSGIESISHPSLPFELARWPDKTGYTARKKTIKEAVLEVLRGAPEHGLTANEILNRLQKVYDPEIVRTSLSPQLSRLKEAGKITSDRPYWRLPE
jgi:hypothetical protein